MKSEIIQGECLEVLRALPNNLVQTVITSPPYYGLRDYGNAKQIGLEEIPDCGRREVGMVELRLNLTSEEFQYVLAELKKYDVI